MQSNMQPESGFLSLGLAPALVTPLTKKGVLTPTPIQAKAIPEVLAGRDVIGIAQTGTGKTYAFSLPILQFLVANNRSALVLVPTRELALQVEESVREIARSLQQKIRTQSLIGGIPVYRQIRELQFKPRFLIATPGRLNDLLEQKAITLDSVEYLVLDEADRMFDMGFAPQVKRILSVMPTRRQTLLFSATMSTEVADLATRFQKDPVRIEVAPAGTSAEKVEQELCYVSHPGKADILKTILGQHDGTTLIFTRTKHGASKLRRQLEGLGHDAAEIHANRSLAQRRQALDGFKNGRYRILVATDIAARGIDVKEIGLVVNYDLPDATEDYVHRIGRTGRAGSTGKAVTFATSDQRRQVKAIESLIGRPLIASVHSLEAPKENRDIQRSERSRSGARQGSSQPRRSGGNQRGAKKPRPNTFRPVASSDGGRAHFMRRSTVSREYMRSNA